MGGPPTAVLQGYLVRGNWMTAESSQSDSSGFGGFVPCGMSRSICSSVTKQLWREFALSKNRHLIYIHPYNPNPRSCPESSSQRASYAHSNKTSPAAKSSINEGAWRRKERSADSHFR
jgi:hypothetical protein